MNKNLQLVKIRHQKGLTQKQVSDLIEIDRSYYTKIENGQKPSVKVAKRLAKIFDIDWTIFFEDFCAINAQKSDST
ncbi:helix-turn-helix domain-containing protein [Bacillus sonorensis]|uniref:helix-turn-helix domain-containing protein n=1 Tax=Bacillus sonorensis TaxID=119858 RepID=UPI000989C329|nr:helix-turn-helix transcriptional regulator [Bacillus sonorensis]